jgi:hypothetical protein
MKDTFTALRDVLKSYENEMVPTRDSNDEYLLDSKFIGPNQKPIFFAGVRRGKAYVSFLLFPIYMFPDLLEPISDGLRRRMQGRSCFNFRKIEQGQLQELEQLTRRSAERLAKEGVPLR